MQMILETVYLKAEKDVFRLKLAQFRISGRQAASF